jgi:60 kDa SS-A/Ro ribonucleoprotein
VIPAVTDLPAGRATGRGPNVDPLTIADPSDPGMLDIVGFDAAVPQLIAEFA